LAEVDEEQQSNSFEGMFVRVESAKAVGPTTPQSNTAASASSSPPPPPPPSTHGAANDVARVAANTKRILSKGNSSSTQQAATEVQIQQDDNEFHPQMHQTKKERRPPALPASHLQDFPRGSPPREWRDAGDDHRDEENDDSDDGPHSHAEQRHSYQLTEQRLRVMDYPARDLVAEYLYSRGASSTTSAGGMSRESSAVVGGRRAASRPTALSNRDITSVTPASAPNLLSPSRISRLRLAQECPECEAATDTTTNTGASVTCGGASVLGTIPEDRVAEAVAAGSEKGTNAASLSSSSSSNRPAPGATAAVTSFASPHRTPRGNRVRFGPKTETAASAARSARESPARELRPSAAALPNASDDVRDDIKLGRSVTAGASSGRTSAGARCLKPGEQQQHGEHGGADGAGASVGSTWSGDRIAPPRRSDTVHGGASTRLWRRNLEFVERLERRLKADFESQRAATAAQATGMGRSRSYSPSMAAGAMRAVNLAAGGTAAGGSERSRSMSPMSARGSRTVTARSPRNSSLAAAQIGEVTPQSHTVSRGVDVVAEIGDTSGVAARGRHRTKAHGAPAVSSSRARSLASSSASPRGGGREAEDDDDAGRGVSFEDGARGRDRYDGDRVSGGEAVEGSLQSGGDGSAVAQEIMLMQSPRRNGVFYTVGVPPPARYGVKWEPLEAIEERESSN